MSTPVIPDDDTPHADTPTPTGTNPGSADSTGVSSPASSPSRPAYISHSRNPSVEGSGSPTPRANPPLPSPAPRVHVRMSHAPGRSRQQRPATASSAEGSYSRGALLPALSSSEVASPGKDELGDPVHVPPTEPSAPFSTVSDTAASWPLINSGALSGRALGVEGRGIAGDQAGSATRGRSADATGSTATVLPAENEVPNTTAMTTSTSQTSLSKSATARSSPFDEGSDWATFMQAYAMGRWDPNKTPNPPNPSDKSRAQGGHFSAPSGWQAPQAAQAALPVVSSLLRRSVSSAPVPNSHETARVISALAQLTESPLSSGTSVSGSSSASLGTTSTALTSASEGPTRSVSAAGIGIEKSVSPSLQPTSLAIRRGMPDLSSPSPTTSAPPSSSSRAGSEPPTSVPHPQRAAVLTGLTHPGLLPKTPPASKTPMPSPSLASATAAATMRWAGSNVDMAPLSLPSPEHELIDPLRGFTVSIPGTHDQLAVTRKAKIGSFWEGTQDVPPSQDPEQALDTIAGSPSDDQEGQEEESMPSKAGAPPASGASYFRLVPRRSMLPPASAPLPHAIAHEAAGDYFSEPRGTVLHPPLHPASRLRNAISPASSDGSTLTPASSNAWGGGGSKESHDDSPSGSALPTESAPVFQRRATDPALAPTLPPPAPSNPDMIDSGAGVIMAGAPFGTPDRRSRAEREFSLLGYLKAPHPPDEEERRKALYRFNVMHTARDVNFDRIAHLCKLVFKSKIVYISLVDGAEQWFKSESGVGMPCVARENSFCGHMILQRGEEPMVVLDATKDWRFQNNPVVTGPPHIRFYAGAPLRTHDGYSIGSLCVMDDDPWPEFTPRQRHTLKEFAAIAMREMELWRDKIQLRIRDRIQTSMEQFTRECIEMDANDGDSMNEVYDRATKLVKRTLDVEGALVIDISHFDMLETTDEHGRPCVTYHGDPYGGNPAPLSPHSTGTSSHSASAVLFRRHEFGPIPALPVLGAAESATSPAAQRTRGLTASEHAKLSDFLSSNPDGKIYESIVPACFRHLMPMQSLQYAMIVPVWNIDRNCFVVLLAYTTDRGKHYLEGYELQYLRAIGVIILSAMLKRRMILADKAKSHFISNISHELRTPLHGILAAAELLADTRLSGTQSSFLHTVQACATSLVETVNHVLDFTKLSGAKVSGQPEQPIRHGSMDLVTLVEETAENCFIGQQARAMSEIGSVYAPQGGADGELDTSPRGKSLRVEIVVDVSLRKKGWNVSIEKGGIRRVLTNLIGNSLKFTTDGYVEVALRELPDGATPGMIRVELAVNDTGKGISKDFLKNQLFHPFSQENPMQTGTGLGLAIVNSIVRSESVNGKVDVWSVEGEGTEIRVSFDAEVMAPDDPEATPNLATALDVLGSASVSLLGFDSDHRGQALQRNVLRSFLHDWWDFALCEDEDELGDILMINEDLGILRELVRKKDVSRPVVMISSVRGDQKLSAIIDAFERMGGFCHIVFKPGGPSRFLRALKLCLAEMDLRRRGKSVTRSISENLIPSRDAFVSENRDSFNAGLPPGPYPAIGSMKHKSPGTPMRPHFARSRTESGDVRFEAAVPGGPQLRPESSLSMEEITALRANKERRRSESSEGPNSPGSLVSVGNGGAMKRIAEVGSPPVGRKARVLVVEDNPINRRVLSSYLSKRGHEHVEANDGQEGVDTFAMHPPSFFDVLLVDMSMPRLDGCDTTVAIRKIELTRRESLPANAEPPPSATIFALTGLATAEDKRKAFNAGVDGYLVKPVSLKSLDQIFNNLGFS